MFEQRNFEEMDGFNNHSSKKSDKNSSNQDDDKQTAEYDFGVSDQKVHPTASGELISPFGGQHLRINSKIRENLEQTLNPKLDMERLMDQNYNLDHRGNLFDGSDIDRLRSSINDDERPNESNCESILSSKIKSLAQNF